MLVRSSPPQDPARGRGPTIHRAEWSTQQEGVQHHAQVETTHWSAPQHSYGKVVADVAMRSNGHAVQARRQVEVLSARAPGVMRILKATITSSSTSSSSTTQGHRHFDDLQLSVNPLDISSQKERTSVGRSGALGGRRPPTRVRPALPVTSHETSPGDDRSPLERLSSPSIVANGVSKFSRKNENQISGVDIVEVKSDSDKNSIHSDEPKYKVNYPDNESEDSFYDSCPEKDSIFKDETEQLEEWRRTSKIRRSLQFPKRHNIGKPILDLPENWGSVSRIKKELENFHTLSMKYQNPFTSLEKSTIKEEDAESLSTQTEPQNEEDLLIKPSSLKTKSFISLETLNEVRGRLKNLSVDTDDKNLSTSPPAEKDDGIDTEDVVTKTDDTTSDVNKKGVKSYVFGMETMLNSINDTKLNYPGGTNSLESRVSKLNGSVTRTDDWYLRRKSYGFEKVGQKNETFSLANHLKNNIESSTDSGICRSSELVNSINNSHLSEHSKNILRGTVVNIDSSDKRETFEDWLQKNRKTFSSNIQNAGIKYRCLQDDVMRSELINDSSFSERVPLNIPIKSEESSPEKENIRQVFHRKLAEGTTLTVESRTSNNLSKLEDSLFPSKRHTIAVDGIKEIRDLYEQKNDSVSRTFLTGFNNLDDNFEDSNERRNKKVEFCKTEVHFAAESGRVNIVATDEKPPSTNNFRRRRRNSGIPAVKENTEKNDLPITHFGDNLIPAVGKETIEKTTSNEIVNGTHEEKTTESLSLSKITQSNSFEETTVVKINGDLFDDNPRGILKNKPIKPRPYHLGEDREIKPENDETSDHNLWGIKLKPVKDSPLWKSSVLLNSEIQNETIKTENEKNNETKSLCDTSILSSVEEINKINKMSTSINDTITSKTAELKGYSTKVNIGSGDATVQSIYQSEKKQFVNSEDCYIGSHQRISNTISTSKCINIQHSDNKRENVTTKICIDVTLPVEKNNIQNSKITESSLYALKSTALVKDTVLKKNSIDNNMILIERNDGNQVKIAYKSKLCELRKMYEGYRDGSEDSADEEVGRLMGISWSRRRAQRHTNHLIANSHHNINTNLQTIIGKGSKHEFLHNKSAVNTSMNFKAPNLSPSFTAKHSNTAKNYLVTERKQNLERSINSSTSQVEKSAIVTSPKVDERKTEEPKRDSTSFGDTLNTPRSLLPGRGSARKLKEHELTYFGVKEGKSNETNHTARNQTETSQYKFKQVNEISVNKSQNIVESTKQKYKQNISSFTGVNKQPQMIVTAINKKETDVNKQPQMIVTAINKKEKDVNKQPQMIVTAINKKETDVNKQPQMIVTAINKKEKDLNKQPQMIVTAINKKETDVNKYKSDKHVYENVNLQKNTAISSPKEKPKHPGESIIEELTKAADEILQALNGFSGEETGHNSSDDDARYRNSGGRSLKPLETIKEYNASKILENKAVQANLPYKEKRSKHSSVSVTTSTTHKKAKSSSNSSLDSVKRESVSKNALILQPVENGQPEKPQRKKIASVESVKARRLQRASSRDALLKVHGSSSEDLPGNIDSTVKRKSFRRLKSGEVKKQSSNTSINTHSSASVVEEKETSKYSLKSIASILPEIRHKTAVSTIKPINEKSSSKEKSSKSSKTNSKERSRRREKLQEATISSMNRSSRPSQREKSRSADTSLERPASSVRIRGKDTASYHGDEIMDSNQLNYLTIYEMTGQEKRKSPENQQSLNNETHDTRHKKEPYTYHRERSHDKLSSYFKKDDTKSKQRDSSTHRSEKHKSKESSSKKERSQIDLGSTVDQQVKEKSSRHRDSSHDRVRTRDSSANRREKSGDRTSSRHTENKKHEISKLRKLLGNVKESSSPGVRPIGGSSKQVRSSTHTRIEHD